MRPVVARATCRAYTEPVFRWRCGSGEQSEPVWCSKQRGKRSASKGSAATRAGVLRSGHAVGTYHLALLRRRPLGFVAATACCFLPRADGTEASTAAAARWRSASVASFPSGTRANRPWMDRAVLGATHHQRPRLRCAQCAPPGRVFGALLERVRTLLTPTATAKKQAYPCWSTAAACLHRLGAWQRRQSTLKSAASTPRLRSSSVRWLLPLLCQHCA